jgi:asparagine synthase (glutamine-hydrolysing)
MCGIAGIFRYTGPPNLGPLAAMSRAQAARGPDESGEARFDQGGFAVQRLAITDPGGGQQPMWDPSGRICVAMNGQIYNHRSLRAELVALGFPLRTTCDTEVVAALIASRGLALALERLDGMFALAAYDRETGALWLARDRMGERPLHYAQLADGTFCFSSELKGLLAHPGVGRTVDSGSVARYLLFEYVPSPRTIYEGVCRLEPGQLLRVDAEGVQKRVYWERPMPVSGTGTPGDLRRWAKSASSSFQTAVFQAVDADVPPAYVLSGGLDSSAVATIAARRPKSKIHAFTVRFSEPSFDEFTPAAAVAAGIGAEHTAVDLPASDLPGLLDTLQAKIDEPLGDSSLVASWRLYEAVRSAGYKVVLSGDGGDELFGGYPTYSAHLLVGLARPVAGLLARATSLLPTSLGNVSFDYKAKRFVAGLDFAHARRHQIWLGAFLPDEIGDLYDEGVWSEVDAVAEGLSGDAVARAMALDQRLYLGDGVLTKVDRAAQGQGVEVRSPFLNHRFVELAAQIPTGLKVGPRKTKVVWRKSVEDLLPPAVMKRPKKGFGTPLGLWLKGPCTHLLDGLPDAVAPWLKPDAVAGWIAAHRSGEADNRRRLWTLLMLARWLDGPWGPRG